MLNLAHQPSYRWLANPVAVPALVEAYRANALFDAHGDVPLFDYQFFADEVRRAGEVMADLTAWPVCSANSWFPRHANEVRIAFGALNNAVAGQGDVAGCAVHTDMDSQFRSRKRFRALARHSMVGYQGPRPRDRRQRWHGIVLQPAAEEHRDRQVWANRDDLWIAVFIWIERIHDRCRSQVSLGRLPPIQSDTIVSTPATQAADPNCHHLYTRRHSVPACQGL